MVNSHEVLNKWHFLFKSKLMCKTNVLWYWKKTRSPCASIGYHSLGWKKCLVVVVIVENFLVFCAD